MWNPCLFRSSLHVYVVYFEWKTFQDRSSSLPRFRWNITKLKSIRMANHGCRVYESYYTVRSLTLRPVKERKKTNMSWPPSWPFTGRFHLALAKQFEKGNNSRGHSGDLPRNDSWPKCLHHEHCTQVSGNPFFSAKTKQRDCCGWSLWIVLSFQLSVQDF